MKRSAGPDSHSQMHHTEGHPSNENHMNMNQDHSENGHDHHSMMVQDFKRRFWVSLFITIPILLLSPMIQQFMGLQIRFPADSYLLFALSTFLFIYGGLPFLKGAVDELKEKAPAMMTLIAFAISVSYVYSSLTVFVLEGGDFFWELATLITIMLLGHFIEMKSVMGASMALEELAALMPQTAHRVEDDGSVTEIPVRQLGRDDRVLIKPGESMPIDGIITEGQSTANEAMVTGESMPVGKQAGDEVIGGSINGEGVLTIRVTKVGNETFLSQVILLVRQAQMSKSKTQRIADRAARLLFYIALVSGAITFTAWILAGHPLNFAIERAVTVIVICCPHALGLAMPLVTSVSTSLGAKKGLLIRDRAAFEYARKLNTVVFDKTGTLTQGSFGVTDMRPIQIDEEELLANAYWAEANSEHLIAKGIIEAARSRGIESRHADNIRALPGKGLQATVAGDQIMVVSPGYLDETNMTYDRQQYEQLAAQGKTVVFVIKNDTLLGSIALSDMVRPTAADAVARLKEMGIEPIMLTGDNQKAASHIAKILGVERVYAEVLPNEKAETIDTLHRQGRIVAMTGDGINDAPSLAKADLGIAIGAGTEVAIETADVILVKSNPLDVVNIIRLSKAVYRKMIQNLIWATGYNIIALPLAAGILFSMGIVLSPAVGAVLMSLSTIIVAINAKLIRL